MVIKEFEYLQYKKEDEKNYVKSDTFEALEKFVLDNEETAQYLKVTTKKGYGKVLQAQNYVGVIQTKDGTTIEILPKIQNVGERESKKILIQMLKTLKKSPFKNFNMANLKSSKMPLLEIFISMFLEELNSLIQRGIKSDYITKEENLKFLKGKLLIGQQIKYSTVHKERFFVEYQEFLSDRVENRLIKTTLKYLYKKSKSNRNQQRIREFLFVFDEVCVSRNIKIDFSKVKQNRQMKDYEQVLLWCRTFLFENSFSPYKGDDIAFALLFDMNLLFESYVGAYLKQEGLHVSLQDKTHHLAYENGSGKFRLKPDIVINKDEEIIIADTKWKILSEDKAYSGVAQADMYQLYAYGTKYEKCNKMYLIYPKDHDVQESSYDYFEKLNLQVVFFDVNSKEFTSDSFDVNTLLHTDTIKAKGVAMSSNNYHPKLLKIFSTDELDLLVKDACYSHDKDGQVNVIIVNTDKISVEIFTDCEAKEYDHALITVLDDCGYDYPKRLTKDAFWEVFNSSDTVQVYHAEIDL